MHMLEKEILKGETSKPLRFSDCLLCCLLSLSYHTYVRNGIHKGKTSKPLRFWECLICYAMRKKTPCRTDFGTVFNVVYYLWLTVHMWEEGILKGETSPQPHRFWNCLLCCVLSLVYRVHVVKLSSNTELGIVFYVVYYLWLTMHMWEKGILEGETSRSRIKETAKRGTGHRLHNIRRCNFTQLEITMQFL